MKTIISVYWNSVLHRHDVGSVVDGASEITAWLSDDLPRGNNSITYWLDKFNAIATSEIEAGYLGTGNAHHVRAIGGFVFLECQFDDEMKVLLTHEQIISVLQNYRVFVSDDCGDPAHMPPPFEVEYEASGEEALDRYLEAGGKLGHVG